MKGKAAIFLGPGKGYEIQEHEVPDPEPEGIIVRVTMAGICGSDLHINRGDSPVFQFMAGGVVGHEMTGRVHKLGSAITTDSLGRPLKEGDRIAYAYFYPCNRCYQCNKGQFAACPNKLTKMSSGPSKFNGAYAEYYHLKPGHWVFKVPDELSDEMVTPVNCALSQVTYGLHQAGLSFGDTLVIQGAGGLGINACAVAREMGADAIIVIDGIQARLDLARRFGADETINLTDYPTPQDRIQRVMELTGGRGADVVAEFVGVPSVVPEGLQMVRAGGTYLEIGNISFGNTTQIEPSALVWGSKRIVGVVMYDPWVIPEALDFLVRTKGKYPFDELVSHKYPLDQINKAFEDAEWQREGDPTQIRRAVITP
ncbi:MAG TPA: zinc-binding dehydrogenase [Dehalococcoidia bacterium]|nr:zinc-binding dehydrogenase [Dehalococcoidia bacterium]